MQQLTRYYDALLEEKPFQEQVDYDRVFELVEIATSFHRDNLIDHALNFKLIQFYIIKKGDIFYLELNFVKESKTVQVEISYQEIDFSLLSENITEPPRLLLDWLGACNRDEQEGLIEIRQQILTFHSLMQ
ncbi:MAG: hypothetical protein GDA43_16600 [Hormoscilla sp. SP5CHS1]|nr:hypothetical protein [Hormoscilla sp. SP5CHS1]